MAGKAEVFKHLGRPHDAIQLYNALLKEEHLDDQQRVVYRLALCHLLKLTSQFTKAYRLADSLVQEVRWSNEAILQRASAVCLLENALTGMRSLPASNSNSEQDWKQHFFRGVMLLKLDRFKDARKELVDELAKARIVHDQRTLAQLSQVFSMLAGQEVDEARKVMAGIESIHDVYLNEFRAILEFHIAAMDPDRSHVEEARVRLQDATIRHPSLKKAAQELIKGDFSAAIRFETDFMLMAL